MENTRLQICATTLALLAKLATSTCYGYQERGAVGLHELSRCPRHYANLTDGIIEKLILHDRRRHPTWGPKKLRDSLLKKENH